MTNKPTAQHLELFTELLVLFTVMYAFFGPQLAGFGVPTLVVQVLGAAYLFVKYLLPQLPGPFQVNKAESDLQAQLAMVATTVTALQVDHGAQLAAIANQLAQLTPQQTQTTLPPPVAVTIAAATPAPAPLAS